MSAVWTLCARCVLAVCAVSTSWAGRKNAAASSRTLKEWHGRCKDAVGTSCERSKDDVGTLSQANFIFLSSFAATSQRADRFSERCSYALACPFGVTGALGAPLIFTKTYTC